MSEQTSSDGDSNFHTNIALQVTSQPC